MYIYYADLTFFDDKIVNGTNETAHDIIRNISGIFGEPLNVDGDMILKSFEMDEVTVKTDIMILCVWAVCAHTLSVIYLTWSSHRRVFTYTDKEEKVE
jgi:hypothetical protein